MPATSRGVDPTFVNQRVDEALASNRRTEKVIIAMASAIFILGASVLMLGYWRQNVYVGGATALFQGFLIWPIRETLRLRRENLALQVVPIIVSSLPPREAAIEIRKML